MSIASLTIVAFMNQVAFIGLRTLNIKYIAVDNRLAAIVSGAFIHIVWLIGIAIGADSGLKVLEGSFEYIPVILGSLTGGILGTYLGMSKNK